LALGERFCHIIGYLMMFSVPESYAIEKSTGPCPCLSDRLPLPCPGHPALPLPHVPKQTDPSFLET